MEFTKTPIDWQNKGTEPSSDIKTNGFTAGYKPPAEYHNYLFANAADCIKEVQQKLSAVGDKQDAMPIKSLAGQQVTPSQGTTKTASEGATIIGDLRERTFETASPYYPLTGAVAAGKYALAVGSSTAEAPYSTAIGQGNVANGSWAFAGGYKCKASTPYAFVYGTDCSSTGYYTVSMGAHCKAQKSNDIALGNSCVANGNGNNEEGSMSVAIGYENTANSSSVTFGYGNIGHGRQFIIGKFAKNADNETDAFVIGRGSSNTSRSNAFRVTYEGKAYGLSAYGSSGADYAEYFEWTDGNPNNEDRRGRLVTLDGEKIRFATSNDDYILGVISATPCVEGDNFSEDWQGKYLTDVFGQKLTQTVHVPAKYETVETVDPETGETTTEQVLIEEEHDEIQWVLNPDFDDTKEYVSREFRKEWSPVGMIGKLVVVDDGTCEVNGYCEAGENGIATTADSGYRVLSRIDDTHIRVLVK